MRGALSDERTGLPFARVTALISLLSVCTVYILHVKVKVKVILRLTVYSQSVRLGVKPLETHDQTFFQLDSCGNSPYVTSSLTRKWVCLLWICLAWVGFEPRIPTFERAKTAHALDRAATVIGRGTVLHSVNETYREITSNCAVMKLGFSSARLATQGATYPKRRYRQSLLMTIKLNHIFSCIQRIAYCTVLYTSISCRGCLE
jgi:hypothetical protein